MSDKWICRCNLLSLPATMYGQLVTLQVVSGKKKLRWKGCCRRYCTQWECAPYRERSERGRKACENAVVGRWELDDLGVETDRQNSSDYKLSPYCHAWPKGGTAAVRVSRSSTSSLSLVLCTLRGRGTADADESPFQEASQSRPSMLRAMCGCRGPAKIAPVAASSYRRALKNRRHRQRWHWMDERWAASIGPTREQR